MSETTTNVVETTLNDVTDNSEANVNDNDTQNVNGNSDGNAENSEPRNPGSIDPKFYAAMYSQVAAQATEHNNIAQQIKDAGDRVALLDSLRDNPEQTNNEEFISLAKRRQELSDALEETEKAFSAQAEPFIQEHLKKSGVEEKQSKADEIAKQVKATIQFMSAMGASTDGIPSLTNRSGRNTSTSGDGRGAGVPKYRNLEVYVDGKRAEQKVNQKNKDGSVTPVLKSNLTYGANAAGVPADVFREAFTNAQGTTDPGNFKDRVEFNIKDANGKEHTVVVKKMPVE